MKLPTKLVFVKDVNSSVARSSFPADQIDKVANLIISVEGIINPIIVKRTGLESYEVVDGHFEYYAAVRARELSPLKGEMIQAIILEPENEETLLEQVNILRRNSSPALPSSTEVSQNSEETINLDQITNIEDKFINLEKIFKAQFDELQKSNRHLESRMSELATQKSKLDLSEEITAQIITKIVESLTPLISARTTKTANKSSQSSAIIPLDLNSASVDELSKIPNIKKYADKILELRTRKGRFSSFDELHEISGIKGGTTTKLHEYLVINNSDI